jgi:hypothetical protein
LDIREEPGIKGFIETGEFCFMWDFRLGTEGRNDVLQKAQY